jgi:hypothetical protein
MKEEVGSMEITNQLKPCPFCGSSSVALVDMTVRCGACCAVGPFGLNAEQAVRRWNERVDIKLRKSTDARTDKMGSE